MREGDWLIGPPLSMGFWTQKRCSFTPRYWTGSDDDACGAPAILHLAWGFDDPEGVDGALACADHMAAAMRHVPYEDMHSIGDHCCLPGALWILSQDGSEGYCHIDMDGGLESLLGTVEREPELVPS